MATLREDSLLFQMLLVRRDGGISQLETTQWDDPLSDLGERVFESIEKENQGAMPGAMEMGYVGCDDRFDPDDIAQESGGGPGYGTILKAHWGICDSESGKRIGIGQIANPIE